MMRVEVTMHEAKSNLSRLVVQAESGEEVIITRAGKPVARLVPLREAREPGSARGLFWVGSDFEAPLPGAVLDEFEVEHEVTGQCATS